jgi:iron complex transport system substrate-binding protein
MRAFAFALASSFLISGAAAAAAPKRVVSLNLCTDELLLMLAAPAQIVSVTHLSQQKAESAFWARAQRYRTNDGSLLSVARLRPDLVLTMGGGARDRTRIAERLGVRIVDLPYPQSLADIETGIRMVAAALGRKPLADQLVQKIATLKAAAPRAQHDTIWLGGGGRSVAAEGLTAQWMALAGFRQRPLTGDRVSLEQLLVRPPKVVLRSDYRSDQYSGEQRWLRHPLARHARKSRTVTTDGRAWTCMGPALIPEIVRLRKIMA